MKFAVTLFAIALATLPAVFADVTFNVAPQGIACGSGTPITCFSPSATHSCKGNFSPAQFSLVITRAQDNCHVSLYPLPNQQGGVVQRFSTANTNICIFSTANPWLSYGIYCA